MVMEKDRGKLSNIWKLVTSQEGKCKKLAVMLACGACLLVIVWPGSNTEEKEVAYETTDTYVNNISEEEAEEIYSYTDNLSKELEALLSQVDGVGNVEVMITLKNTDVEMAVPELEGVLIACTGGGNGAIATKITEAVQALFDVPAHKIVVLELK
jgi:stage III sporulation protein AG